MVGPPKSLHDLSRLSADLRLTCRCGHEAVVDRDYAVRELTRRGRSLDWSALAGGFKCGRCGKKDLKLAIVPFRDGAVRRQLGDPIAIALSIVRKARDDAITRRVDTIDVQLALLVLLPHCGEQAFVKSFWEAAAGGHATGRSQNTNGACNGIERQLRLAGRHPEGAGD